MGTMTRRDVIKGFGAVAGLGGLVTSTSSVAIASPRSRPFSRAVNKRDVMLGLLDGTGPKGYVPAAFFLHFDPAFHRGQAAIDKHLEYFRYTDMDFVKIQYELTFPARTDITRPSDWARMPHYGRDFYAPQLDVVKGLVKAAKRDALVILTIYSPFMCAGHTSDRVTTHLAADPDAVKKGLEIVTDSLIGFVKDCVAAGVDGFYASTQGGEADRFASPAIFRDYIKPYDLALMNEMKRSATFNILHVCDYVMPYADTAPFLDYPGHVVNAPLTFGGAAISPKTLSERFARPYMGGLERKGLLATGTEDDARRLTRALLQQAPARFILGADCTVPSEMSWANLKAAIAVAHGRG